MKPDFALNFTDTSIALLHRTAKGWLKIGETPFDASDLEDALDYMRKTALGLAPGGFATKLVIPASQILYTEVDISGGDEDRTRQEISNAIEARTPYKAAEVAWDWVRGEGRTAHVAAVARETLDEAESFAITHKFNPVSFVAIPEGVVFDGEPWFGQTADAANFLADGEVVERERAAIMLIDDARAARRRAKAARQAEAEAAQAAEEAPVAVASATSGPVETAAETAQPVAPQVSAAVSTPVAAPDSAATDSAPPAQAAAAQTELPLTASPAPAERAPETRFAPPAPFGAADQTGEEERRPAPATEPKGPRIAITEITPLGSIASATSAEARASAPAASAAPATPVVTASSIAAAAARAGLNTLVAQPAAAAPPVARPVQPTAKALPEDDPDEAPFAHVPENTSFPEADEAPDLPPLPHLARRMAGLPPVNGQAPAPAPLARQTPAQAPAPAPAPVAPVAAAPAKSYAVASDPADEAEDDLPPRPSDATLAAYGRSTRAGQPVAAPSIIPPAPPADENIDDVDTEAAAPVAPRPLNGLEAPQRAVPPAASKVGGRGLGGLAGLVTAPSIPGTRKTKAQPATASQSRAAAESNEDAARSLGQTPFSNQPSRGKPRFLGLILTAILLLCLALVAAWSSFYLSSNRNAAQEETQFASGETVSPDDEMLADGIDPEAAADGVTGDEAAANSADTISDVESVAATPATNEAAPGTQLDSESPAAVALLGNDDEIFLSSADVPPPAFDALSLPGPDATAEAPPGAPMPPPPFGTVYRFDENGLLIPTAAGLPTPGGYMLYEGKPPRVPPARSAVAEAAAAAARAASSPATTAPAVAPPAAAPENGAPAPEDSTALTPAAAPGTAPAGNPGNPSLAGDTVVGTVVAPAADEDQVSVSTAGVQPNPELADRRPRARPEAPAPADGQDDAAAPTDSPATEFAGLRPRARPAMIEAASARARAETATASLANEAEAMPVSAPASATAELSAAEAANPSIMMISRRPAAKPKDFSRAVEAAVAAAVRAPDPEPAPAPEAVAAAAPAAAPAPAAKSKTKSAAKPDEQHEIDEPEVASAPAPKIPTKASVAKQATFAKAITLSKINLIGVYGTPSNRYALVRLPNAKFRKVTVGDKIDGGQVKAITQNEVRYQKGGRLIALSMPKG